MQYNHKHRPHHQYDTDLIIVASKGLGFLDGMLVGSTATGIIRGAQSAVFAFPLVAKAPVGASTIAAEANA